MRGLMRILIMFGPMIFRQFQRSQRGKQQRTPRRNQPQDFNPNPRHEVDDRVRRHNERAKQSSQQGKSQSNGQANGQSNSQGKFQRRSNRSDEAITQKENKNYQDAEIVDPITGDGDSKSKKGWSIKDIFFKDENDA